MNIQEIRANSDGTIDLKKIITCTPGEFIFATYDSTKDEVLTSEVIQEVISYCQDNGCPCLVLPESNEQIAVALQDYDAESLRRLEGLVHQALQKKSKILLT
jgi:hypothetical protein